ncbi:MAG: hypothetical protein ACUVQ7_10380 [bacterium]
MACDFSLHHYKEILEIALTSGYKFLGFHQHHAGSRAIYLRHDLDVSPEEALPMAAIEADLGVQSTYFFLVNSSVYNLFSRETFRIIKQLQSMGHWVGLHIDTELLEMSSLRTFLEHLYHIFEEPLQLVRVVSFHRPGTSVLGAKVDGFISVYEPRFFSEIKYISDSRGIWRFGCPCQKLRVGEYSQLQLLVHPIWWVNSGAKDFSEYLQQLLDMRVSSMKAYLADNITPIGELWKGG